VGEKPCGSRLRRGFSVVGRPDCAYRAAVDLRVLCALRAALISSTSAFQAALYARTCPRPWLISQLAALIFAKMAPVAVRAIWATLSCSACFGALENPPDVFLVNRGRW